MEVISDSLVGRNGQSLILARCTGKEGRCEVCSGHTRLRNFHALAMADSFRVFATLGTAEPQVARVRCTEVLRVG
jgi:hypothetical protein